MGRLARVPAISLRTLFSTLTSYFANWEKRVESKGYSQHFLQAKQLSDEVCTSAASPFEVFEPSEGLVTKDYLGPREPDATKME